MPLQAFQYAESFALRMDEQDPLRRFRECFFIPEQNGKPVIYLCGNSLGLQPKQAANYIQKELDSWARLGVEGHFQGENPWVYYRKRSKHALAALVGSSEEEVVAMNQLSTNLHLLLVSFYRPKPGKYKILTESGAFPSDQYILESQTRFHGYAPHDAIIELTPRDGKHTLETDDILEALDRHSSELALIIMSGVQYYTGQRFDMARIAAAAQRKGIPVGFDLAHAVGNVPLSLHAWGVDFATWCSYKYLNSGPGNVSGVFVHQRHARSFDLPRFAGWWGHEESERFQMKKGFKPMPGADGWLLSNDNVLGLAAHQASLDLFMEAGLDNLTKKREQMTGYLEFILYQLNERKNVIEIITPKDPNSRGAQLSLFVHKEGKALFEKISEAGVVCDWREPNVIRIAPAPLYTSYEDIYKFAVAFEKALHAID
ncbi:MAG: kynureninase [Lunatimonas sp.]|uniref:kynureninase n=1 Tax=Lunatimonas sp. TaxID=2060141 RepID=UPI00263B0073|nr:kynureninase [Lunatimonas sp.]MCC5937702.1 kynureninase [Lunatimonas sp.]